MLSLVETSLIRLYFICGFFRTMGMRVSQVIFGNILFSRREHFVFSQRAPVLKGERSRALLPLWTTAQLKLLPSSCSFCPQKGAAAKTRPCVAPLFW